MAGNKKGSKRVSAGTGVRKLPGLTQNFLLNYGEGVRAGTIKRRAMYELAGIAERSLQRLAGEGATIVDWNNVMHRIYVGVHAYRQIWRQDDDVESLWLDAFTAMWIVRIRESQGGGLGVTWQELDHIKIAMEATLDLTLGMSDLEVVRIATDVEDLMASLSGHLPKETERLKNLATAIEKRIGQSV